MSRVPDEIPELPDDVAILTSSKRASGDAAVAAEPAVEGERPPLRELDKAPLHLRKAALIVIVGSLIPFMGHHGGWVTAIAAKLVVLFAGWLWFQQIQHNWGPRLGGFLGMAADLVLAPKKKEEDKKPRRTRKEDAAPTGLRHPFPTLLHVLSLLAVVGGCLLPLADPSAGIKTPIAFAEAGMLAWAVYTFVHIHAYERWGHFNPLFPLMFLGIVFAGVVRVLAGVDLLTGAEAGEGLDLEAVAAVAGGLIVAVGGGLAAYTIVEALMQAKKEGDLKKQAAMEARRAARKARRS